MAIDWGGSSGRHQVGIDISMSPSSPSNSTTSVTLTIKFYVRTDYNSVSDTQTLRISGSGIDTDSVSFSMTSANNTARLVATRKYTRALSYSSGYSASYSASLSGVFSGGTPSNSRSFSIPRRPIDAPSAPGTPTASNVQDDRVTLAWAAPSNLHGSSIDYYRVEIDNQSSFNSINFNPSTTGRSITVTGLSKATTYYVRIRAASNGGASPNSGVRSFKTKATEPSTPGTPSSSSITATSVKISWSAPSNGGATISGYDIRYSTSSSMSGAVTKTSSSTSITLTGLTRYTTYYVQVRAKNSVGASSYSGTETVKTARTVPTAPGTPVVGTATSTTLPLTWSAPTDNGGDTVDSYTVQWSTSETFTASSTATVTSPAYTITNLHPTTTYYVRVRATNVAGTGQYSPIRETSTVAGAPSIPLSVVVSSVESYSADMVWAEPTNDNGSEITGYLVEWSTNNFSTVTGSETIGNETVYYFEGLTRFTTYYARVRAINANGMGTVSAVVDFKTLPGVPGAAAAPTTSGVTANQMTVIAAVPSDDGASPITGYAFQFSPNSGFTDDEAIFYMESPGTTATRLYLGPSTTYYVRTAALNMYGTGAWSAVKTQATLTGYTAKLNINVQTQKASSVKLTARMGTNADPYSSVGAPTVLSPGKLTIPNPLAAEPTETILRLPGVGEEWHNAWTGTPNASTSTKTALTRQLIGSTLANQRAETWIMNWGTGGAGTQTVETTGAPDGGSWRKNTLTTKSTSSPWYCTPNTTAQYTLVTPGVAYTSSAYLMGSHAGSSVRVTVQWFDASGVSISVGSTVYPTTMTTSWQLVSSTAVAPPGAYYARVMPYYSRTNAQQVVGEWWGIAQPKLEQGENVTPWEPRQVVYTNLLLNPRPTSTDNWRISTDEVVRFLLDGDEPVLECWDSVGGGGLYVDPSNNFAPTVGQWIAFGIDVKALDPATAANMRLVVNTYNGMTISGATAEPFKISEREYTRLIIVRQVTGVGTGGYVRTLVWPSPVVATAGNGFRVKRAVATVADTQALAYRAVEWFFDGSTVELYPANAREIVTVGLEAKAVPVHKLAATIKITGTTKFGGQAGHQVLLADKTVPKLTGKPGATVGLVGTTRFQPYGDPLAAETLTELPEELTMEPVGEWDGD